jgi:hypothetical protein
MTQVVILFYFAKNRQMSGFFLNGEIWISNWPDFDPIFSKKLKKMAKSFCKFWLCCKRRLNRQIWSLNNFRYDGHLSYVSNLKNKTLGCSGWPKT